MELVEKDPRRIRFELKDVVPRLFNGDRLTQSEFHAIYKDYPEGAWFELVEDIVFETHRRSVRQSRMVTGVSAAGLLYETEMNSARGHRELEVLSRVSLMLDDRNEVHPDFLLRRRTEFGGHSRIVDDFIGGPPELIVEVATHRVAMDYHLKRDAYQRSGVAEYIVISEDHAVPVWYIWPDGVRDVPADGIVRSVMFPGFWIDTKALYADDQKQILATLQNGLSAHGISGDVLNSITSQSR